MCESFTNDQLKTTTAPTLIRGGGSAQVRIWTFFCVENHGLRAGPLQGDRGPGLQMQLVQQSAGGPADDSVRPRLLLRLRAALGGAAEQLPRQMSADLRQGAEPRPAAEEPHPEAGDPM